MDQTEPAQDRQDVDEACPFDLDDWSKTGKLIQRIHRENVIDTTNVVQLYDVIPPHRRLLLLVILLSIKDMASQLVFEPCKAEDGAMGIRMAYEVDGRWYDLVPPPVEFAPLIAGEFLDVTRHLPARSRLAVWLRRLAARLEGHWEYLANSSVKIQFSEEFVDITYTIYSSPIGDRVFLWFSQRSPSLSQTAQTAMKATMEAIGLRPDEEPGPIPVS